eukprot:2187473-Heterocapsa_arctica.AAC.1
MRFDPPNVVPKYVVNLIFKYVPKVVVLSFVDLSSCRNSGNQCSDFRSIRALAGTFEKSIL